VNNSTGPAHQRSLMLLWKFSAWIVASALGIIAVGDGQSCITLYLSRQLLMKWLFILYICKRACALQTLVHSSVGQPRYLTSSLAAGGSHTVPVSSYICTPSASAKQAYRPPVWSFGIHFGKPFGKTYKSVPSVGRAPDNTQFLRPPFKAIW